MPATISEVWRYLCDELAGDDPTPPVKAIASTIRHQMRLNWQDPYTKPVRVWEAWMHRVGSALGRAIHYMRKSLDATITCDKTIELEELALFLCEHALNSTPLSRRYDLAERIDAEKVFNIGICVGCGEACCLDEADETVVGLLCTECQEQALQEYVANYSPKVPSCHCKH